jgi:AcrR family transcriptional regulator
MSSARTNRGPSAAAENRAALITAARKVFADGGFDAPLSAVAREAGVGQGSLYRHFPDRLSLALAVFEENVEELERESVDVKRLLTALTRQMIVSTAFIEVINSHPGDSRSLALQHQVESVFRKAATVGGLREGITADDLMLAAEMVSGALMHAPAGAREGVAQRAWALLSLTDDS